MAMEPQICCPFAAGQQIAFYPDTSTECVRATMETVAADLGIMWIVTECGKRKILYLRDNDGHPQIDDAIHQSHHDATVSGREAGASHRPGRNTPKWPISGEATYSNYLIG